MRLSPVEDIDSKKDNNNNVREIPNPKVFAVLRPVQSIKGS